MTHEEQAHAFLQTASQHRKQLTDYAWSLTKDRDNAHDLFQDSMLKCHDRILSLGFTGSYVAYLSTAIKLNYYCLKRDNRKVESLSLLNLEELTDENDDADFRHALAVGISSFVSSHYKPDEVAIFDLHVAGQTYPEIAFVTQYTYWQSYELIKRIKKEIRANFNLVV